MEIERKTWWGKIVGPMRIYVAGKYSGPTRAEIDRNVEKADEAAREIARRGHTPFCPHKLTDYWENDPVLTFEDFLRIDKDWLRFCDAILILDNWKDSRGATQELEYARALGLKIFWSLGDVPNLRLNSAT